MKILGIITVMLLLVGCSGMSNEEIVEQTKYCKDNGMDVRIVYNLVDYRVTNVICIGTGDE